ncbi:MAG: T9SS type A sorting domain-containing protein [Lewinellaceae bacterium]|nr:T9SS type A sorting domain-containing protein [Saprospiraceae bacterium]MCB9338401.1 T9SS type A sorting domain-containing protein [Lewinellaceae bacterium]
MKNIAVLLIFLFQTGLTAQTTRYFEFSLICGHGNWQDTSLIAATDDPAVIADVLEDISKPFEERRFIIGPIAYGHGGHNHNAGHWFLWHFVPNEWSLTEAAFEVCDGCPFTDVDGDTAYWVGSLGQFCPWAGKPAREVDMPTNVDEPNATGSFYLYPNPAAGRVFFYRENPAMLNVTIFDATGRMMLQQAISPENQSLGIGHLTPGLYFVKSQSGDTFVTRKLHVIR